VSQRDRDQLVDIGLVGVQSRDRSPRTCAMRRAVRSWTTSRRRQHSSETSAGSPRERQPHQRCWPWA